MTYVQYFQTDLAGILSPALGDRAVVVLDGRNCLATQKGDAVRLNGNRRPKYEAYQIFTGRSFTDSQATTKVISLS